MVPRHRMVRVVLIVSLALGALIPGSLTGQAALAQSPDPGDAPVVRDAGSPAPDLHTIHLKSREFVPTLTDGAGLDDLGEPGRNRVHILLQLDYVPRQAAKDALAEQGIELLAYVPDYTWIASVPAGDAAAVLQTPGAAWAGPLTVADKLAPAIRAAKWTPFNRAPDGTVAVHVVLHGDVALDSGRTLVEQHAGRVTGEVIGTNTLVVEMPESGVQALAAEEAVQWIEPAGPPLTGANDGILDHIHADALSTAPYELQGTGVDVLIYDSGQAGDHVDFGTRLTHGDADSVSTHSTHVAGTIGGSGANSQNQGGTALQWRGLAPSADLISYGTQGYSGSGVIFYEDVPDIENDWASAQNTYGADLANASLGSNIYSNYPGTGCDLMGVYGASAVLLDQIIRGGNSVVGIGDKYIAAWAAGNERGWASTCGERSYNLIAPPASAKNPIHVGGSNTNNTTQYIHTSWGPTEDGRLKPIVTAGGCQTTGDYGITSTDDSPTNSYTVMCGTSMATPAVSGGIALMLEHYRDVYNTTGRFWPSTAKAILMQTASDQGRPGPDYQWGYGLVDIQTSVDLISRKAFKQAQIDDDEVDVYQLVVPSGDDLRVSLAWDDHEATVNADPTLINDLDLELVSPGGTRWHPWVLNPSSPTQNATRGVNDVDNQEQVEVPNPEIGTWLVRVLGTTVPQGPQDYSLVCEGCEPLNLGVCQSRVDGTAMMAVQGTCPSDGGDARAAQVEPEDARVTVTEGEVWQRALEADAAALEAARGNDPSLAIKAGMAALEAARQVGPEAVVALLDTLRGPALDLAIDEIQRAQEVLREAAPPPPDTGPVSERDERAARDAQRDLEAANRAQALQALESPNENLLREPVPPSANAPMELHTPAADRTVGSGCTYGSISAAIAASNPGDRLLIEGNVTFYENVTIPRSLTLQGGYNGCASGSTKRTTVDGGGSGRVFEIAAGLDVTLENLNITNGDTGAEGGGIRFAPGPGTGDLTLTNVLIHQNTATYGGGLWVGLDAQVNGTSVQIYDNTATTYGGGIRLYGGRAEFVTSNIDDNTAPAGGGVYATQQDGHSPILNLPMTADITDNQALTGDGLGGGVYMRQGTVSLSKASDLYSNDATVGGGAYLVTATLTLEGSDVEINYNTATGSGGGVYAQGSSVNLDDDAELAFNDAGGYGGGAYLDDSTLRSDKASINHNEAQGYGGGVYATHDSIFDMDLGTYTCLGPRCSRLYNNIASTGHGGGVYLSNSRGWLDNTFVENNSGNLGGGVYAYDSTLTVRNSLFTRNHATSGFGYGVRLYSGSSMSGSGNTFAYNASGGAGNGRAIDLGSSDLTLSCSIVWGHAVSINPAGEDVTYSDVQGGYAGTGNLDVNPQFVAPGSGDFHLQLTSPAIDRCLSGLSPDFEAEQRPIVQHTAASPYDMGADEASAPLVGLNGASCAYGTVQQAVNAAADGDVIQIASGVYFENVDIFSKDLTLVGGYDTTCAAPGTDATRIEGSVGTGSALGVHNGTVTLRDLELAWGSGSGGGLLAGSNALVTLDHTTVHDNHASYGGGIYVNTGSVVTLTNDSDVINNTATMYGGGARVLGTLIGTETLSDISDNCAPHGGGVSVNQGTLWLAGSDMHQNEAAAANGMGGGIHAVAAEVALDGNAWVYHGDAYDGAGIYADGASLTLMNSHVGGNDAIHDGGGLYLTNGSIMTGTNLALIGRDGYPNTARYGGGIYLDGSHLTFAGSIAYNTAGEQGGGIAALGASDLTIAGALLRLNTATGYGGGIYAQNSHLNVHHSRMQRNVGERGGAISQEGAGAVADLSNTLIYSNTSTAGFGAGIRSEGGSVTMTHMTLAHNISGAGYSQSNTEGLAVNSIAWGNDNGGFWVTSGNLTGACSLDQSSNAGPNLNPQFAFPGLGEDYRLNWGSPAIDRCPNGLPDDIDAELRPHGRGYDAGAFEYPSKTVYLPLVQRNH